MSEQCQWVEVQPLSDALDATEHQVALAPLDAAHVGAVDAQDVGEVLLAEVLRFPVGPQVALLPQGFASLGEAASGPAVVLSAKAMRTT